MIDERVGDFDHVGPDGRCAESQMGPEVSADQGDGIQEGQRRLGVPLSLTDRGAAAGTR